MFSKREKIKLSKERLAKAIEQLNKNCTDANSSCLIIEELSFLRPNISKSSFKSLIKDLHGVLIEIEIPNIHSYQVIQVLKFIREMINEEPADNVDNIDCGENFEMVE